MVAQQSRRWPHSQNPPGPEAHFQMKPINIYLCRHGFSTGNGKKVIGQATDTSLTDLGREQAAKLGAHFIKTGVSFDRIFASSYERASQTARIIGDAVGHKEPIHCAIELVEYNCGDWRNKPFVEIFGDAGLVSQVLGAGMKFRFPNGESLAEVERRASAYIEKAIVHNAEVLKKAETVEQNFLVVSHGHTIRTILHYVMGFNDGMMWDLDIWNCCINHLIYRDVGWKVRCLNETGHLEP